MNTWISAEVWDKFKADYTVDDLRGREAYAAIHISPKDGLASMVLAVKPVEEGEPWKLLPFLVDGEKHFSELRGLFDVMLIAYDRWMPESFGKIAGSSIFPRVGINQGFKDSSPSVTDFEEMLLGGRLVHNTTDSSVFGMNNVVIARDHKGKRKPSIPQSLVRIDMAVAAIMAVGLIEKRFEA